MSKTFSIVTLSTADAVGNFVYPGIIHPNASLYSGVSIDSPPSDEATPDDFCYDHMDSELIDVEYIAHCYGTGDSEDPSDDELLALALILHEDGDLAQALDQVIDIVESGTFRIENPFFLDPDDEDDEE